MNQKNIINYSLDLGLSNTYLKIIIQCLELKKFNEKVEVLFFKKRNKPNFHPNIDIKSYRYFDFINKK